MAASVRIPTVLRGLTDGSAEVRVPGETVRDLLAGLEEGHPGFAERILDEQANYAGSSTCSSVRMTSGSSMGSPHRYPRARW